MAREHREKNKRRYQFHETGARSKKQKVHEKDEDTKIAFQRKLEREHEEYIARVKKAKTEREKKSLAELKNAYEIKCKVLFGTSEETVEYKDIPWPYPKEKGIRAIKDFLLCDVQQNDVKTLKKYLRDQQIRWHPDKFVQKCGNKLKPEEKDRIMKRVNQISQELNSIAEELLQKEV